MAEFDAGKVRDEVPIYKCWWSYDEKGCSLYDPDSKFLDFNEYGWLYLAGGVLIVFAVVGILYALGRATTPATKNVHHV